MNSLNILSTKGSRTLSGVILSTALTTPLYAQSYYKDTELFPNGSFEVKTKKTPETFSAVQINSYQQDMNIDEMLVNVFERMSRESKVTDNEISRVLSENMLDLLL